MLSGVLHRLDGTRAGARSAQPGGDDRPGVEQLSRTEFRPGRLERRERLDAAYRHGAWDEAMTLAGTPRTPEDLPTGRIRGLITAARGGPAGFALSDSGRPASCAIQEIGLLTAATSGEGDAVALWRAEIEASSAFGVAPERRALIMAAMAEPELSIDRLPAVLSREDVQRIPFDAARGHLVLGGLLRRNRRPAAARLELDAALEIFTRLGATPWAARAQRALRAAGRAPTVALAAPVPLTTAQWNVVRLAAAGLSNQEIAASLHLSPRTVGAHLYRVFPKLGVTNRAGLRDAIAAQARAVSAGDAQQRIA